MGDDLIESKVEYIAESLEPFIKKHHLVINDKTKNLISYRNNSFGLEFYFQNRYLPMIFEDMLVTSYVKGDFSGANFRDVINFMQKKWGLPSIDTYEELGIMSDYLPYLQSHLEPFLKIPNCYEEVRQDVMLRLRLLTR